MHGIRTQNGTNLELIQIQKLIVHKDHRPIIQYSHK